MKIRYPINVIIFTRDLYRWQLDLLRYVSLITNARLFTLGIWGNYPWKKLEKKVDTFGKIRITTIKDFLPKPKLLFNFLRCKAHLLILYSAESLAGIMLFYLSKLLKIFTLVVVEDNRLEFPDSCFMKFLKSIKIKIIKNMYSKANAIIVESLASKNYLERILNIRRNDIVICVHGIDTSIFKPKNSPKLKKTLGLENNKKVILFVGEFSEYKGGDILIECLPILVQREVKNYIALIPSFGKVHEKYKDQIAYLRKNGWLNIYKPLNDLNMPKLYSIADIVVVPSRFYTNRSSDRSPNSLIEALACGKIVIASYAGGIPTIAGDAAILIPPNNPEALALKIQEIFEWSYSKCVDFEFKARTRAEKYLNMRRYVKVLVKLYLRKRGILPKKVCEP